MFRRTSSCPRNRNETETKQFRNCFGIVLFQFHFNCAESFRYISDNSQHPASHYTDSTNRIAAWANIRSQPGTASIYRLSNKSVRITILSASTGCALFHKDKTLSATEVSPQLERVCGTVAHRSTWPEADWVDKMYQLRVCCMRCERNQLDKLT